MRVLQSKLWQTKHSRDAWKVKRVPNKKSLRRRRQTILTPEQDLQFMVEFNITWSERKRLKAWMRQRGVDFFSISRDLNDLLQQVSPESDFAYSKVCSCFRS